MGGRLCPGETAGRCLLDKWMPLRDAWLKWPFLWESVEGVERDTRSWQGGAETMRK